MNGTRLALTQFFSLLVHYSLSLVLAFMYVFDKSSLKLNTLGFPRI